MTLNPLELHNEADEKEAQAKQLQDEARDLRSRAKHIEVELLVEADNLDRQARDMKYEGAEEAEDVSRQADEVRRHAKGV